VHSAFFSYLGLPQFSSLGRFHGELLTTHSPANPPTHSHTETTVAHGSQSSQHGVLVARKRHLVEEDANPCASRACCVVAVSEAAAASCCAPRLRWYPSCCRSCRTS
jgi:hypothetical protein